MTAKDWIIKTATKREKWTLIVWSIFYQQKMKKFIKNLELGMNVKAAIKDVKNTVK